MKTLDHNAIGRSLQHMTIRLREDMHQHEHRHDAIKLTEVQLQHQLDISGVAGAGSWTDYTIMFQETLHYAPTQRDNKNEDPQFWYGAVLDQGDAFISVHVKKWIMDDHDDYKGAVVRVGVMLGPYNGQGGVEATGFRGTIHCTFQGLGTPVEDPGFDETP